MGNDKTPLTFPQTFEYKGIFEPNFVYDGLKSFLEEGKGYDGSEKEVKEKNIGDTRELKCEFQAELDATDHIRYDIQIEIDMRGKNVVVEDDNGVEHIYIDGKAFLKIYSFLVFNDNKHRHKSPFVEFFLKVYSKYFNTSEMAMLSKKAKNDVSETITRFKQLTNMSTQR